jgi:ABC-type transport system involved in multi-copper enzyme maturation permease subunit
MMSLLKLEGYKLLYSKGLWIVIAVVFVLALLAGAAPFRAPSQYSSMQLSTLSLTFGGRDFLTYEEFFDWLAGYVFSNAMSDSTGITLVSLILAAYFFGTDFKGRTFNGAIYSGKNRIGIVFSKLMWFFVLTALISILSMMIVLTIFAPKWFSVLPAAYILRCFAIRILLDIATMCIPVIIAFVCRGIFKSVVFTILAAIVGTVVNALIKNSGISFLLCWYPGVIYFNRGLWETVASPGLLISMTAIVLCFISGCVAALLLMFRKADLK